jgi:hypothetical protein
MRGIQSGVLLAAAGSLFFSPASGQVEGTYRFAICEGECTSTDSLAAVATGELVLFPDSSFLSDIPSDVLDRLERRSLFLRFRGSGVNACFRFSKRLSSVGGHELFAGIIREGLTRWAIIDGGFSVALYRSPDGHFTVSGTVEDGRISGKGAQAHGMDPRPPDRAFLAERLGPPDASRCTGG